MGKWLQLLKEVALGHLRRRYLQPDTALCHCSTRIEAAALSRDHRDVCPVHDDGDQQISAQARELGGGVVGLPALNVAHRDVIIAAASRYRFP
jgi:hypothetical protein